MNRQERRAQQREQHDFVSNLSLKLTPVSPKEFPTMTILPDKAWVSRSYLVQLFYEHNPEYPELIRLSICRTKIAANGRWQEGLAWDELQAIKREIGYGDWYGIEIYPPDRDVVNVSNMRHIWLLPIPLSIGWFN